MSTNNNNVTTENKVDNKAIESIVDTEVIEEPHDTGKHDQYDPDDIESVVAVINKADPISKIAGEVETTDDHEHTETENKGNEPVKNTCMEAPSWTATKKRRKIRARRLLLIMCVVSMMMTNILVSVFMNFFWALIMSEAVYSVLSPAIISIITIGHMVAYSIINNEI